MNEIVNKFLLAGDKFMPEMHLKQPGFTYSACGPFTKNKERIEKFMQSGNTNFIYKNELDKACFQHDMDYGKTKDLAKRTQSLSKYNKEIKYLLSAIDLLSKYAWDVPTKDKKGTSTVNAFQKIISEGDEESQIKYGLIKVVNFTIILLKIF